MEVEKYIPDFRWPKDTDAIAFTRATRDDAEGINALFNRVFGQQRPLEHFLWKYWENPAGAPYGVIARARDDGRVLAASHGIRKRVWVEGREVPGILMCETSSDPDARGGGRAFKGVMQGFGVGVNDDEGIYWSYGGQSSDEAIKVGKRWLGFRIVVELVTWEQRLSYAPGLRRRLGAWAGALARPVDAIARRGWQDHRDALDFEEVTDFGSEFDDLFERYRDLYPVVFWRDAATLNWRYRDCPVQGQRCLLARRNGVPVGWVIWREWTRDGVRLATVLDLWDGADEDLAAALLDAARRAAARARCDFLRFAVKEGSVQEAALRRLGCRRSPHERVDKVICTPMPGSKPMEQSDERFAVLAAVLDGDHWYYVQGDCDYLD